MKYADRFKIAFSTLGCPAWDMKTILKNACDLGFKGVEFRGYRGELDIYKIPEFSSKAGGTVSEFKNAQLEIPCFSTSIRVSWEDSAAERQKNLDELKAYSELCNTFETHYIRTFAGYFGDTPINEAVDIASNELSVWAKTAKDHNVILLLETHDDWLDSSLVKKLLNQVDSKYIGVLCDTHHPYRFIGEEPELTWQTLGRWIKHTHWKDSCWDSAAHEGFRYCSTGKGDIPFKDILQVLTQGNYTGYLTFEWEKMWRPDIDSPEIAFPEFSHYMTSLLSSI